MQCNEDGLIVEVISFVFPEQAFQKHKYAGVNNLIVFVLVPVHAA